MRGRRIAAATGAGVILVATGTGVALAAWSSSDTADLPTGSATFLPAAPTFTAKSCQPITNYITSVTVNFLATSTRVTTYQVYRGVTAVGSPVTDPDNPGQSLSVTDTGVGLSSTATYTVKANGGPATWTTTSNSAVVNCP